MTVDEIALLRVLAQKAKDYYHRKNVYRLVLAELKASGVPYIDDIVGRTLQDPLLLEATDRDFSYLDQRVASIAQPDQDQVLREYLVRLPPTDPN